MRKLKSVIKVFCLLATSAIISKDLFSQQQLKKEQFALLTGANSPGTTLIGSSITINGGSVGSYKLVQTTGNVTINANIYSGDQVILTNSNVVNGNITAANSSGSTGNIINIGSSLMLTGNIIAKGNVNVGGGSVTGTVTIPNGNNYFGPTPTGGVINTGAINTLLPILPVLPTPKVFPAAGAGTITGNTTLTSPGVNAIVQSGDVTYTGNKTLTLKGPGIYVFNSIVWTGNSNKLVFNFDNKQGNIYIYVHGNADFGKLNALIANNGGGDASRIYLETHGNGVGTSVPGSSFVIANGSSGGGAKWQGTAYATAAAINIGSGTGSSTIDGAFFSPNGITIQSGVTLNYVPFLNCTSPVVNAGSDTPLDFKGEAVLTATSSTQGLTYNWQAIEGGVITSSPNSATITVNSKGKYIVTAFSSSSSDCPGKDTVEVTASVRDIIGSELLFLYQQYLAGLPPPTSSFYSIQNGLVKIDVIAYQGHVQEVRDTLVKPTWGLTNIYPSGLSPYTITGDFPIANLLKLNNLANIINFVTIYDPPSTGGVSKFVFADEVQKGVAKTAGDTTLRTYLVRSGYDVDGTGSKICILSNSFATILNGTTATLPLQPVTDPPNPIPQTFNTNTFLQDIANGDLPGDTSGVVNPNGYLTNVKFIQPDLVFQSSDEGRAMAQIIHDIAPGAELFFRTVFYTPGDFAQGIQESYNAGCRIIAEDVIYASEPFYKDGVVAQKVNEVKNLGMSYFVAAGNYSKRSHEFVGFNGVDATSIGFPGKTAHNFGSGGTVDMFQHIRVRPGDLKLAFQWLDDVYSVGETNGTQYDLDIFISKSTNGTGLKGYNRNNFQGDPKEFIRITIEGDFPGDNQIKDYYLLIINNSPGAGPARGKYIVFQAPYFEIVNYNTGNSTTCAQAAAEGAMAIGAVRFNHVPGHPLLPAELSGITKPQIESFSSYGGTWVNGSIRNAPAFTAADGVNTTVKLGQDYPNAALDGFSNFFGTSAASPHAAAAAALLTQVRKKFIAGHPSTTPDQIKTLFSNTATDMRPAGLVGYDFSAGAGLINADAASRTIAAPKPFQIKLDVPANVIPCESQFVLKIVGENFSNSSIVYLISNGDSSILTPDSITPNEILVTIVTCEDNPEIVVYTPPITAFEDGGWSNSKYLFDAEIVVQAVNVTKKYGQSVPLLDTIITINGTLLQDTTLTLADIGLSSLQVQTPGTTSSSVGTYVIQVIRNFDTNNPADVEFLKKYNYKFIPGTLTIEKLPVHVVPQNKTINYGDYVGNIVCDYQFDPTGIPNVQALTNEIRTFHEASVPNNALAVIKDFNKVQADGTQLTAADIANLNTLATFRAVNNSRKFALQNGKLVPLTDPNTFNKYYLVDVASESIHDYKLNPSVAKLYGVYPGINKKGIVGSSTLAASPPVEVSINNNLVQMVNASMVQMVNTANGPKAPILNDHLVQIVNGTMVQAVNGQLQPVPNQSLVQYVNESLVQFVNGEWVPIPNLSLVQFVNESLVQFVNNSLLQFVNGDPNGAQVPIINASNIEEAGGSLVQIVNGVPQPIPNNSLVQMVNNSLVQFVNGTLVQFPNGSLVQFPNESLLQFVNESLLQFVNSDVIDINTADNTAVIIDEQDAQQGQLNWLGSMFGINMITGLGAGTQKVASGYLKDPNLDVTYGLGTITINKATITVKADNKTRPYGDSNPPLTVTYSGFQNNETLATSGVSGSPNISTTAVPTSPAGTYPITVTSGNLSSSNYQFSFVNGTLTVTDNACLLTHSEFKNFGNTPVAPVSLWFNLETKVSGQLTTAGDFLLFKAGSITFNNILSTPLVNNLPVPNGKIIAVSGVTQPVTHYDAATNTWITEIPPGFSSTSDIFVTGAIINSSNGFVKKNGNTSSVLKGIFYSNKNFSDQWAYGIAAYTPQFGYSSIAANGLVASTNGTYKAGTPIPQINNLVGGGSGGGGNSYTGSSSAFDNFTACLTQSATSVNNQYVSNNREESNIENNPGGEFRIIPNPASDFITISLAPLTTGKSKIIISAIDGRKIMEVDNGNVESGNRYIKKIDVSKLANGIYIVQVISGNKTETSKIVINH